MAARDALTRNQICVLERLEAATGPLSAYTLLDQLREQPAPQTTGESVDYILEGLPYLKSTGDQP